MGCDIHVYPEAILTSLKEKNSKSNYWGLGESRFRFDRNYILFGVMAGVRYGEALFAPRGVPNDMSWYSKGDYHLFVSEEDSSGERNCSRESADNWVKRGISVYADDEHKWVTHPDWHTPSYLMLPELLEVREEYMRRAKKEWPESNGIHADLEALIAMLKSYEQNGYSEARIVFWFDN